MTSSTPNRRRFLQAVGSGAVGLAGAAASGSAAEDDEPEASVVFEAQPSDGTGVTVAEASSAVDGRIVPRHDSTGSLGSVAIEAGESLEDVEVPFDVPIEEEVDLEIAVSIYEAGTGSGIARDTALVQFDGSADLVSGLEETLIDADPDAGFDYPYYLYAPTRVADATATPVLVEPVNSGTATDDFAVHLDAAERTVERGTSRRLSEQLGAPLVVPVFPRPHDDPVDWRHYVHALDRETLAIDDGPLERVDLQLLAMVADARDRLADEEYPTAEGIMLNGFSASGNFVERFAALQPEAVVSVTAGGLNGMPILPLEAEADRPLPYHVGIADLEAVTGEPFDLEAFCEVHRFLYMGEFDGSDTIPYGDAFTDEQLRETALDVYGIHMVDERFPVAKAVYEEVGVNAVFRTYEGAGHSPRPAEDDLVEFHERALAGDAVGAIRADLGGNVTEVGAHVASSSAEPDVGEAVTLDASRSTLWDDELVSFEWQFDDGQTATGPTVTRSFDAPGGHNVVLTATDEAGNAHRTVEQLVVGDVEPDHGTETELEFRDPPRDGDTEVIVRYSVAEDASDEDSLRIRVFEETGDQIIDSPGFAESGDDDALALIQLSRPLVEGEPIHVALLPPGGFDLDGAQEDALAMVDAEVDAVEDAEQVDGVDPFLVEADPDAGFDYPYYLYAPETAADDPKPLVVEPTNSGTATDDFAVHLDAAERTVERGTSRRLSEQLGAALVVPVFPRPRDDPVDATHYVHALDRETLAIDDGPLERVDLQLLAMVADARDRLADEEYPTAEGIMLNGFSASGNFVERFAALHPEAVVSVTAGGLNGMPILPVAETVDDEGSLRSLPYHVGIADLEAVTGEPFDLEAFRDVHRFLYVGELDMNDTIPFSDAWTDDALRETALAAYGRNMHADRFPTARAVYEAVDAAAVFRQYEGEAHTPRPAEDDLVEFHERTLAGDDVDAIRADLGGGVPNRRAAVELAPRTAAVGVPVAFHATDTDLRTADPVDFAWDFDDGETATGPFVAHAFDAPGSYGVTLTVTTDTGATHQATEYVTIDGESPLEAFTNDEGVVDTEGLRRAIDDWRGGDLETDLLRDVIDYWRSGDPVDP